MPVLKPVRGIRLNKSHPLARGLVGYWLLNEGSGNKVFDLSGNGNEMSFVNSPVWSPGNFGQSILFDDGSSQYLEYSSPIITDYPVTLLAWFNQDDDTIACHLIGFADNSVDDEYVRIVTVGAGDGTGIIRLQLRITGEAGHNVDATSSWNVNTWNMACAVYKSATERIVFLNAGSEATDTDSARFAIGLDNTTIGRMSRLNPTNYMSGKIGLAMIYNRALSASEIALLHREPFCMFDRAWRPLEPGGQIVELAGTATALSSVEGCLSVSEPIVELAGTIAGRSNVNGYLSLLDWTQGTWLTEALFNGMTANAFKLGTTLSLGWFWVRVTGCSALYRGPSMGEINFGGVANILTVSNLDACEISPPSYISHDGGAPQGASTYFYVVRRFNNCGYQELTLAAAVKVVFDGPSGELTEPQPNNIAGIRAEQVDSNKVRLTWFYCPLEQGSGPVCFNVYYDDRTGQIDYENPLNTAIIEYKGRRFYSFQSNALEAGDEASEHLFAIRAEDAGGIENISLARLKIQLETLNPDAIDILRAEAV